MPSLLTPTRRRGVEYLDEPGIDPRVVRRSLADVSVANALFGGTRAVLREVERELPALARAGGASLLDVGTGIGDIPARARDLAERRGVRLGTVGLDVNEALVVASRERIGLAVRGDARRLPFADGAFDVVTCSQTLHHFADDDARRVLAEMHRVARGCLIVSDLRRSWLAAAGIWLASFPLGFHPVSRHDGVVSVLRGYTRDELSRLVVQATGAHATVRHRIGWRVTAVWSATPPGSGNRESPAHVERPGAGDPRFPLPDRSRSAMLARHPHAPPAP